MAYDTYLEERIKRVLEDKKTPYNPKKMMGGLCFMIDDKMCVGIVKNSLMVRLNPIDCPEFLKQEGVRPMDFTGRPMKGYLFIEPEAIDTDTDLEIWVQRCLDFNPLAKSSKKKK